METNFNLNAQNQQHFIKGPSQPQFNDHQLQISKIQKQKQPDQDQIQILNQHNNQFYPKLQQNIELSKQQKILDRKRQLSYRREENSRRIKTKKTRKQQIEKQRSPLFYFQNMQEAACESSKLLDQYDKFHMMMLQKVDYIENRRIIKLSHYGSNNRKNNNSRQNQNIRCKDQISFILDRKQSIGQSTEVKQSGYKTLSRSMINQCHKYDKCGKTKQQHSKNESPRVNQEANTLARTYQKNSRTAVLAKYTTPIRAIYLNKKQSHSTSKLNDKSPIQTERKVSKQDKSSDIKICRSIKQKQLANGQIQGQIIQRHKYSESLVGSNLLIKRPMISIVSRSKSKSLKQQLSLLKTKTFNDSSETIKHKTLRSIYFPLASTTLPYVNKDTYLLNSRSKSKRRGLSLTQSMKNIRNGSNFGKTKQHAGILLAINKKQKDEEIMSRKLGKSSITKNSRPSRVQIRIY